MNVNINLMFIEEKIMGIEKRWNIQIGSLPAGPQNKISDVKGVKVGHCTLADGAVQTGVTAILPHTGNTFQDKVMAASHVINGFGKSVGLVQIDELGTLETPILLTNTFSVGMVSTALIRYMLEQNPDIGETTGSVNPVVCECNDSDLNDIRGMHVKEEHVYEALKNCSEDFEEGAVGAGRGMCCHELKGGIGSASRQFELDGKTFTAGALVMSNHALYRDLMINGVLVSEKIPYPSSEENDKGSIITILATDAPLNERQLKRICRRAAVGLSRTGSYMANGSGEIVLAFTTANHVPHYPKKDILECRLVRDDALNLVFRAVAEAVEESVLSSLLHAETVTGKHQVQKKSLAELLDEAAFISHFKCVEHEVGGFKLFSDPCGYFFGTARQ